MSRRDRRTLRRALALLVLVAGVVALVAVLHKGQSPYIIHAQFENAGQLIEGNRVEVGGVPVGTISEMSLTSNGLADLKLKITDEAFRPLHEGTIASIGTVGATGVTNRFVALQPGPTNMPRLRDGAVLDLEHTRPLVDIDAVLDSITPEVRRNLQRGTQESVDILHNNVTNTRRTLTYAQAALSRIDAFASQLTKDRAAFEGLLSGGATVARTLSEREGDLQLGVRNTATTFRNIAAARSELQDVLERSPGTLRLGTSVLRELRPTLRDVDPTLRDAQPVAKPLAAVLRRFVPTAREAQPVLSQLDATLPGAKETLDQIPPTTEVALPALSAASTTLRKMQPIITALRPYTQDAIQAQLHGLGGNASFNYDANGHYTRLGFGVNTATTLGGVLGSNLDLITPSVVSKQLDRCPGAAIQAPADGSSPLNPGPSVCDLSQVPPS